MEAKFYIKGEGQEVRCELCPHLCRIADGKTGICRVRMNVEGTLVPETYRRYSAMSFDPVEKKPLYHFYPGREILSLGSVGCNLNCNWCQNSEISQTGTGEGRELTEFSPERILQIAQQHEGNIGVAYTYNEPSIQVETITEVARLINHKGLKNVMVSNGFMSDSVLNEYLPLIDAFNIDVKAFDDDVYKKYTSARLKPILDNLVAIIHSGKHLEVTYLLIPNINSDYKQFKEFLRWTVEYLGKETVLHLSRYFPRYKSEEPSTPPVLLEEFGQLAREYLNYVYIGNYHSRQFQHTACPVCKQTMVYRLGYRIDITKNYLHGTCVSCGKQVFVDD